MISILKKIKEVIVSILPIAVVVLILHFTLTPLAPHVLAKFLIGTILMVVSMPIFLLGIDISITPIGEETSGVLARSINLWIILLGGAFFGIVVSVAEPDLHILAGQVSDVTQGLFNSDLMIIMVAGGIGLLVAFGMLRILKNIRLNRFMTATYMIILVLGIFNSPDFLAIAFDASGSTTGSVSVPFILALSTGISAMTRSNEKEENDGFGMLGIASAGAIIAVLIQGLFTGKASFAGSLEAPEIATGGVLATIIQSIPSYALETLVALLPLLIIFLIINAIWIKLSKKKIKRILVGSAYTYVGLVIFLTGVNTGFIEASRQIGYQLASLDKPWILIVVGMIFGVITIPAEPSVHVLTSQIEEETAGSIKALTVMLTLCIGVAIAVGLSVLRILVPQLQLWHILLPGTVIGIALSYFVPDIFVGIAFDSGGVAAGTMTAAFILPFTQGAADFIPGASVVQDGFGVIALVAMTPLMAIQLLGVIYKLRSRKILAESSELDDGEEEISYVK